MSKLLPEMIKYVGHPDFYLKRRLDDFSLPIILFLCPACLPVILLPALL
jgi:hypothetical protein